MATRISTLKPNCGYNPGGIKSVQVIDFDDFIAFGFTGGALYDSCLVTEIQRSGEFADVQADVAKYSGPISNKIVTHTLETFIGSLEAAYIASLHLASRRRYVVIFDGMNGRTYAFGYEAGAAVTYSGQTDGGLGYIVSFTCPSVYPLFEVTPEALAQNLPTVKWLPDFINGAYCETI
jgi:hypothetical protein